MGPDGPRDRPDHETGYGVNIHGLAPILPACSLGPGSRAEIQSYIEIETDDNLARGMTADAARAAAQRKFGNSTLVREEI